MSAEQWAAIQRGNEAYAGAPSFHRFHAAVTDLFPFAHVLPTHQGRAAEKILFTATGGVGRIVPGNTHFDTTRANIEFTGASAVDLPVAEGLQPATRHPFKGNMDVAALERLLSQRAAIPCRTYTQSHMDYVIEVAERVAYRACDLPGMRIVSQPTQLRHFTARFQPTS